MNIGDLVSSTSTGLLRQPGSVMCIDAVRPVTAGVSTEANRLIGCL